MHHLIILVLSEPFEADLATSEWPQISKNYLDIIQTQLKLKTKSWGLRDVVPIPCVPEYVCVHVVWQDVHFYTLLPLSFVRIWDGGDGAEISSLQQHFLPPLNNWNHPQFWARLQLWKLWTADLSPSSLQHCSRALQSADCSLHHEANCEVYFCWWAAFRVFRQPGTRPLHKISNKEST